ncbi:ABC transporter permease [Cryobacterium glaciale]|uniref:ABC transporter permease n=1 Tax=Cryobacterium glaciale TaxID=1259145 RepID=UPI00141ABD1E|nr:ABC transporter permease [Cryobacterium glaciale]
MSLGAVLNRFGLLIVILIGVVVMSQLSPVFFTRVNFTNVFYVASLVAVVAIGQMFVLLVGGIDLSVGAVVAVSSVLAVGLAQDFGLPTWLSVLVALLAGTAFGFVNGFLTTKFQISALIVTLGTLSIARGFAFIYTGGSNIAPIPPELRAAGRASVAGIPVVIIFALVIAIIAHIVLSKTRFGRSIYAVGGNPIAARLSGIRSDRIVIIAFVISGFLAAVGGLMISARLGAGSASAGTGLELTVIAAVVIGGTSLFGGEGRVLGTLLGVLLLGLVQNSINLLAVPANVDLVVSGVVIVLAAGVDVYRRLRLEPALARRALEKQHATAVPTAEQNERSRVKSEEKTSI